LANKIRFVPDLYSLYVSYFGIVPTLVCKPYLVILYFYQEPEVLVLK
jgi:hypothetical protein